MAIFRRQNSSQTPSNVSQVEYQQSDGRRWPMLFAALAAALLIALALFYGGRWVYRSIFGSDPQTPTPIQPTRENGLQPQNTAPPAQNPTPSPTPRSNPPSPSPTQLPNNGPGNVMAVFVTTSLAAAGLHYIISLRRSQRLQG